VSGGTQSRHEQQLTSDAGFQMNRRFRKWAMLTVYGHTDSVGGVDNQKLSVARANAAITYLKKLLPGVTFERSGIAASEPVGDNSTDGGKASNRRAEIRIP
jgi:flagellar motor protein MotB